MPSPTATNNSNYPMQSASCSSTMIYGSPVNNLDGGPSDSRWMQYLSDEAFSFNNNPSFPNHAAVSYAPSKVILKDSSCIYWTLSKFQNCSGPFRLHFSNIIERIIM